MRLLPEREPDRDAVEALYDLSFAPGRHALSSYQLRGETAPIAALSMLMRDEYDTVIGAIRYWPVAVDPANGAALWPALLLGPVAVHPTRQGEGIGAQLIVETMDRAAGLGWQRVILVGDEPFYARFGFRRRLGEALAYPQPVNPERVLAAELTPNAMRGVGGTVCKWGKDHP